MRKNIIPFFLIVAFYLHTMVATITTRSASGATCGTSVQYELPVHDAACGVPNSLKYKPLIESCAKPAGVLPYNGECALYAPAGGQSVQDLTDCLYKVGVSWKDVWCSGSINSTATLTSYPTATAANILAATTEKDSTATEPSTSTSISASNSAPSNRQFSLKSALFASTLFASAVLFGL